MNEVERVKALCKEKGISLHRLEKDLGYANGYIGQLKKGTLPSDRLTEIANYLGVSQNYLTTGEDDSKGYYINTETAKAAQEMFENKELRALFDVQRDMEQEDLKAMYNMALALKRKERGNDD